MPEFKEKPKNGAPKTKRRDMLLPKQAARIMKEKYLQELDQRPEGQENTETQAVGQVEELFSIIDKDQLPCQYGGSCRCKMDSILFDEQGSVICILLLNI